MRIQRHGSISNNHPVIPSSFDNELNVYPNSIRDFKCLCVVPYKYFQ